MNYYLKLYKLFFKKNNTVYRLFLITLILLLVVYLIYNGYLKLTQKKLYIGCLYSETGILGKDAYDNYSILIDTFKYALDKYNCNINIIPIYKNLGDKLENFSDWVEECVKKYNIKYFFGCWRSSERAQVIPVLTKYNLRLFYPLQYEGCESANELYYFGACPNQQIFPGLEYLLSHFYYYDDIYIVGSDYIYPQTSVKLVKKFLKIKHPKKKIIFIKLYPLDHKDFSLFIDIVFKKSPNGAIILNLINGKSFYDYSKQFYEKYYSINKIINPEILKNSDKGYNFLNSNNKEIINVYKRYPTISTSVFENNIDHNYITYIKDTYTVTNFSSQVLDDSIYFPNKGYNDSEKDFKFLKNYQKKQKKPIGDSQYNTTLSVLFFVKILKKMMSKNENINDIKIFDNNAKNENIYGICGPHDMNINSHITKLFYILKLYDDTVDSRFKIIYDSYNIVSPAPYLYINDNIIYDNSFDNVMNVLDRIYT